EVERRVAGEAVKVTTAVNIGDPGSGRVGEHHRQRVVVVRGPPLRLRHRFRGVSQRRHHADLTSRVQHFGPPPALRSSDSSTGTRGYPRRLNSTMSPAACTGSTTRCPSLTAFRPSTAASAALAVIASGKSWRSTFWLPTENASGR